MNSTKGFYGRYHRIILTVLLLLAPLYLWISAKVLTPGDMSSYLLDVAHWLPRNEQLIKDMEKFSEVAGKERGNVVRITWPGCNESDRRVEEFTDALRQKSWGVELAPDNPKKPVFDDVLTTKDFVANLRSKGIKLSEEQIYKQMKNVLIGDDGTTSVIATLPDPDPVFRRYAIRNIYDSANEVKGLGEDQLRMFGGPIYTNAIDSIGSEIASKFMPLSVVISVFCAWFCLRKLMLMAAVFLNAVLSTSFALVSMYVTQIVMDPLQMLIPGFWFIMTTSGGLHFINYYYEEKDTCDSHVDLATATTKIAFRPMFLATLTTCIGLASLCTSEILPVWRFGFHAAVGLACCFVGTFLFLPSFLNLVSHRIEFSDAAGQSTSHRFWSWYESFVVRFRHKTSIVFILLIAVGAIGFSKLGFSNKLRDQFAHHTRINSDTAWIEDNIGPVIPIEVLVRFSKDALPRPSECLEFVDSLQRRIDNLELPNKTLSATAIIPYENGKGARQKILRTILDKKIEKQRQSLSRTGYVIDEPKDEMWRLTVFVFNSIDTSLSKYYSEIQKTIGEQVEEYSERDLKVSFSFAGLGSRMAVITSKLGGGLIDSIFVSALLISLVVIVSLRSIFLGLTAMIPNVFPILMSFGTYGFFHSSLDIGSIMTASIAMGIAVDDTIHFMYWFRKGIIGNLSRVEAIKLAIRKCGRAVAATSLICGCGFLVYFFCDFMPVARFGQLLFIMLGAALVGDLFFLPALLHTLPASLLGIKNDAATTATESTNVATA